jgi:hypothetical protein
MTKREQREAAAILDRLAQVVANGEITAPSGFVGRLEGAAAALKVMSRSMDGPSGPSVPVDAGGTPG